MSTMTKVFVVLTAVLSIVASVLFVSASAQWANWRSLAEGYQAERDAAVTGRDNTAATMTTALAMKEELLQNTSRRLDDALDTVQERTGELEETQSELVQARNANQQLEAGRSQLQNILDVVSNELKGLQQRSRELLEENIDYQLRIAALNSRVLELNSQVTLLDEEVRNLRTKNYAYEQQLAELQERVPPEVMTAAEATAVPTVEGPIRGEIIDVQGSYASVNVGETSGVVKDMVLMVYRDGRFLGELVVSRVNPREAGGRLQTQVDTIQPGDRVSYEQF